MSIEKFQITEEVKDSIKGKTLLFDSCVFVNLIKLDAISLLDRLKSLDCTLAYIHPVLIELLRTDRSQDRTKRLMLIDEYEFMLISLNKYGLYDKAQTIQEELHSVFCHPSPEDIYLGAALATIGISDMFLLTTNQKDFPIPIYERNGNIIIQDNKSVRLITLIKYIGK
jgi:hypothetical protein